MCTQIHKLTCYIISKIKTLFISPQNVYENNNFIEALDFSDYMLFDNTINQHSHSRTCFVWGCLGNKPFVHSTNNCPNNCLINGCIGGHITAMHDHVITDINELFT